MSNEHQHDPERGDHLVEITIEKKEYKSPNPTTGAGLYVLGHVPAGYELFREVRGKGDDEPIANNGTEVRLKEDDRFYFVQSTLNPGDERARPR